MEGKLQAFALGQNWPNPFNTSTAIGYVLPTARHVSLHVYDILGRQVVTLVEGTQHAGLHLVSWDGTDREGNSVSSGVYICRLRVGSFEDARLMTLLR